MSNKYGKQEPHKPEAFLVLINRHEVLCVLLLIQTFLITSFCHYRGAQAGKLEVRYRSNYFR